MLHWCRISQRLTAGIAFGTSVFNTNQWLQWLNKEEIHSMYWFLVLKNVSLLFQRTLTLWENNNTRGYCYVYFAAKESIKEYSTWCHALLIGAVIYCVFYEIFLFFFQLEISVFYSWRLVITFEILCSFECRNKTCFIIKLVSLINVEQGTPPDNISVRANPKPSVIESSK